MSNIKDFVIKKGVLTKYKGAGGNVVVPEGVTSIGWVAFSDCKNLQSVTLPESVTSIGSYAFSGCEKLQSITLPEGVTSIGYSAFSGCKSLQSITLPKSVTSIEEEAFRGCKGLADENGFVIVKDILFDYDGSGGNVVVPEGVTRIGSWAFWDCESLQNITLPEGVTSIGDSAFSGCKNLQSITLPEGVTSVGKYAFSGIKVTHHISDEVANRPENFIIKGKVLEEYIGIGGNVIVPHGVTTIQSSAFEGCSCLTGITLPDGVTSIENKAFRGCENLKKLEMNHCKAKLTRDAFGDSLPEGLIAQVPELYPYMADNALKQYVLTEETWQKLDHAVQAAIFLTRQSKAVTAAYLDCIGKEQLEPLGNAVLERINGAKPSVKDCNAAAAYMTMFHDKASVTILNQLYARLKECKNSAKAIKTVESHVALM